MKYVLILGCALWFVGCENEEEADTTEADCREYVERLMACCTALEEYNGNTTAIQTAIDDGTAQCIAAIEGDDLPNYTTRMKCLDPINVECSAFCICDASSF